MCAITVLYLFPCRYLSVQAPTVLLLRSPSEDAHVAFTPCCVMQAQVQATDALMVEQKFIEGPIESWLTSFVAWAAGTSAYRCALLFRRFLAVRRVVNCAPPMSTVVGLPQ